MSEAQRRARHRQRIEELCAASIRALSGERDMHFRGGRLHRGRRALPLYAPHLQPSLDADDFAAFRGAADGLALRLAHSDAALHQRLAPGDAVERLVFELLEQIRCEALAPSAMPGVRHNLRHAFEAWSLAFHYAGLTDGTRGLLLYTVAQMSRARVTGEPVVEATEDFIESTRFALGPTLGVALAGLRRERDDQAAYATHALFVACTVAEMLHAVDAGATEDAIVTDAQAWAAFSLLVDHGDKIDDSMATAVSGRSGVLEAAEAGYRIFTTAYDREVNSATLVRKEQLTEYREQLDRRITDAGINLAHLARDLKALLAAPARDHWTGGQEAGRIDGRRLAQLIASPTERRVFRIEREEPCADCLVSLLIDCSGSMKEHIEPVAVLVDVLVRALEQAGVASEVLGYTTNAWNGGRARRDWLRAGRPAHPGRLNEACHLVFKDADTPWLSARPAIAALLRADLFREGIDGEAVDWAMRRLNGWTGWTGERGDPRRLLLVVSDGSPMDSATNLANNARYLDHHLKDVVARHEMAGAEVYGVGVGLDLSPYYGRSQGLDLSGGVTRAVLREVIQMIARGARR